MRTKPLGSSGVEVSAVGLGCNNFGGRLDVDQTRLVVDAALDAGVTFFDTADMYGGAGGSERALGEALQGRRDEVFLATKFGHQSYGMPDLQDAGPKGGRTYIRRALAGSLQRLRTDVIDLYQLHTPDPLTPMRETLEALHELVVEGSVRFIGHSNLDAAQIDEAAAVAHELGVTAFVTAQNEWSLLAREVELDVIPAVERHGLSMLPYFPLANGLLTGKVRDASTIPPGTRLADRSNYVTQERLEVVERYEQWAQAHGRTLLEVAIGGLAAQSTVASVIAGATSPDQVRANAIAGQWEPTVQEFHEMWSPPPH